MGFRGKTSLVVVANVLLCGLTGWAQHHSSSRITVFVNDSVGVNRAILRHAETEASRLFRPAGIEIAWRTCAASGDCRRPPRSTEFILHIVRNGKTPSGLIFGEAFLGPDGWGKYADVFFDRIQHEDVDPGQLLGAVSAHELGHLFLGTNAHSLVGIMAPYWQAESLRQISMGNLTFTREQERLMNSRLSGERLPVTYAIAQPIRVPVMSRTPQ